MNNKKATKRALLTSVMALAMCVVMLVGTTFAWFTDTAKTSVNKIQAGNLDVDLQMWNGEKWVSAEGQTLDFKKAANAPAGEAILWEPGCTYELPELRVINNGNLALKYKIQITGIKGDAELNRVIDWTIANGETAYNIDAEHHLGVGTAENPAADVFTIKGHMQESAGNGYMNKTIDGIAITVVATQDTVEYDSIDNQYDKYAQYGERTVKDASSLTNATNENVNTTNITYSFPTKIYDNGFFAQHFGVNSTFDGNGATFPSFQLNGAYVPTDNQESTLVVSNINVEGDLVVTAAGNNVIINNCTAKHISVYGPKDGVSVTIDNCEITGTPVGQTSSNNENGIYITGVKDAEVKVNILNSSISGVASHAISVNGSGAAFTFDIERNNFESYGLNTVKSNRAAFKIWGDKTLAPNNNTDPINADAQALAANVKANNTFAHDLGTNCVVADFYGKTVGFNG